MCHWARARLDVTRDLAAMREVRVLQPAAAMMAASAMRAARLAALAWGCAACGSVVVIESDAAKSDEGAEAPPEHVADAPELDACAAGEPASTVAEARSPEGIALGDGHLFYTDGELYECDGAVHAVPLDGGPPFVLAADRCSPGHLAYADGHVFWLEYLSGSLYRVPLSGGAPEQIAGGMNWPGAIAIDQHAIYLGDWETQALESKGRLWRVDRENGSVSVLATIVGIPADIAVDEAFVYWTSSVGFLNGKENHDSSVMRIAKQGGPPTTLADGLAWPFGMARTGTRVVFAHSHDGEILSLSAGGGDLFEVAGGLVAPTDVAEDGGQIYFTTFDLPGAVLSVPLGGGAPATIAMGVGAPDQIALGATCVYWTERYVDEEFNGRVRKAGR